MVPCRGRQLTGPHDREHAGHDSAGDRRHGADREPGRAGRAGGGTDGPGRLARHGLRLGGRLDVGRGAERRRRGLPGAPHGRRLAGGHESGRGPGPGGGGARRAAAGASVVAGRGPGPADRGGAGDVRRGLDDRTSVVVLAELQRGPAGRGAVPWGAGLPRGRGAGAVHRRPGHRRRRGGRADRGRPVHRPGARDHGAPAADLPGGGRGDLAGHGRGADVHTRDGAAVRRHAGRFRSAAEEAGFLVELFESLLDGRNSHLSDGVGEILGRAPRDFTDFAREAAAAGVWKA